MHDKSHEVLREAIEKVGVKTVAYRLGVSPALVYKWCQERAEQDGSGARNPLDRVLEIMRITGDTQMVGWLCHRAGGFYVQNPDPGADVTRDVLTAIQDMVRHFSEVLSVVNRSFENDNFISSEESASIRREWEALKSKLEGFVRTCEMGAFHPPGDSKDPAAAAQSATSQT